VSVRGGGRLRFAAACALLAGYASLSHYCNATGAHELGAALALAPMTALCIVLAWRWAAVPVAALSTAAIVAAVYLVWPLLERHFSLLYLGQESLGYSLLGLTFARTLFGGRIALCTRLADKVHGPLSAREVGYTRCVTAAWAIFFFSTAATSLLLYASAPLRVWSIFINFCVLPSIGIMFVAEYLVRRRVLPQVTRAGLLATVRVYFASAR
jgi:uncharacterized membrane protein